MLFLSVTLFLIAINGIADGIPHDIEKMLLVDYLNTIVRGTNLHGVGRKLQRAIDIISNTAEMRGFKFNQAKTYCFHFWKFRRPHDETLLYLNNNEMPYESSAKLLGLFFFLFYLFIFF